MKNTTEFISQLELESKGITMVTSVNALGIELAQDYRPEKILVPQSLEELVAIVKLANKYQVPIYPIGSGTSFLKGVAPFQEGVLVSLRRIAKVMEYRPDNMSIEVEAGMPVSYLQEVLSKDNIFFPIDSLPDTATVGGLIAANAYGRKKYMYKTTRFYVMGMEFISPQGEIINVGGRTIKNVSSYDLHQLLAGSWGTFGIITKATLRVKPVPEKSMVLECLVKDTAELLSVIDQVLFKEKTNLASLIFEQSSHGFVLQVEMEGFSETLKWQQELLQSKYNFHESQKAVPKNFDENGIIAIPLKSYAKGLSQLLEVIKKYPHIKIRGNATSGLVYLKLKEENEVVQELTAIIDALVGNFVLENIQLISQDNKTVLNKLLKNIKNKIDPNNILVPSSRAIKE